MYIHIMYKMYCLCIILGEYIFALSPSRSSGADDPETAAEKILRSHMLGRCVLFLGGASALFPKVGL